jgi:predicted DNA-binding transcriptional regulator AlpA
MPERIRPGPAASIVGVSRKTLARLAAAGKIPGAAEIEPGMWRFDEAALRRWLRQKEGEACRTISTAAAKSGGFAPRCEDTKSVAAYERLLGLRPSSAARR